MGNTTDEVFDFRHPFQFHQGYDPGDEDLGDEDESPLGGYRFPHLPPFWHCTDACMGCHWCFYRQNGAVPGKCQ